MVNFHKELRRRIHEVSLSQRLIIGLVLALIAIIIFSGLPANFAMFIQLARQVWLRVKDAQASTQALYDNEVARMGKRAELFAGRPTLHRLIQEKDIAALEVYLESLQEESGNLDVVQVITPDFRAGDLLPGLPSPQAFVLDHQTPFADFVSLDNPARLFIVAANIMNAGTISERLLGLSAQEHAGLVVPHPGPCEHRIGLHQASGPKVLHPDQPPALRQRGRDVLGQGRPRLLVAIAAGLPRHLDPPVLQGRRAEPAAAHSRHHLDADLQVA